MTKARKKELETRIDSIRKLRADSVMEMQKSAQNILYWQTILVMFIANMFIAIVLVPILLMVTGFFAGVVVGILGLLFGMIFDHLVRDIQHLKKHHHLFAGVFIPAVAVFNLFIITRVANKAAPLLGLTGRQDSFILSLVFIVAFLLPYLISYMKKR